MTSQDTSFIEHPMEQLEETPLFTSDPIPSVAPPHSEMKLKPIVPSKYSGTRDIVTLDSWISSVNSYFILSHAKTPYIYYSLTTLLDGEAGVWFRYTYSETQASTLTWPTVRDTLRQYFTPVNHLHQLQNVYTTLRQTTTVDAYTTRFSEVILQLAANDVIIPDQMLLHQYIHGLKPATRLQVQIENPASLREAARIATTYDTIRFATRTPFSQYENTTRSPFYNPKNEDNRGEPMQLDNLVLNEIEIDALHTKASQSSKQLTKLTAEDRQHLRKLGACFKCRQPGHMARECPTNTSNASSKNQIRQ